MTDPEDMTPEDAIAKAEEWEAEALARALAGELTRPEAPTIRDPDGPDGERRFHSSTSSSIWIPVTRSGE